MEILDELKSYIISQIDSCKDGYIESEWDDGYGDGQWNAYDNLLDVIYRLENQNGNKEV